MVEEAALKDLRASLRGGILTPSDAGYDEVRRIHNGMFLRRPALIARCLGTADVVDADEAIDTLIAQFAACPSPMSGLVLEHFHGAAARIGVDETAFAHRRESYNLMVVSEWLDPSDDEKNIAWARATYDALRPHMARASYANYQTEDEPEAAADHEYGPNYAWLVALKNKFDPTNFFHLNSNVRPSASHAAVQHAGAE